MLGIRWLFILLAVWLVVVILRQMRENHLQKLARNKSRPLSEFTAMVACHHCQLHVPKAEAIHKDGRYFCSTDCFTQQQDHTVE